MADDNRNRAHYIDAVKGVAILCITFLHFEQGVIPLWLNTWIGLFMITAFYFTSGWISGMQNKKCTVHELFKKRIKQLGIPYIWFSLLILLFDIIWIALDHMDIYILLRDLYKAITLRGIGTLWFLPALMIGELVFCSIRNSSHKWLSTIVWTFIYFLVTTLYHTHWQPLRDLSTLHKLIDAPLQPIVHGIEALPVIAIGYIISKYLWQRILQCGKVMIFTTGILIIAFSILLVVKPPFEIDYLNNFLSNFLPALGLICIFIAIGRNFLSSFFIFWGINSLILMCTHYSITEEIIKTFDLKVLNHSEFIGSVTIIYFFISILLTYPLVYLFNNKLKFMLGKNYM